MNKSPNKRCCHPTKNELKIRLLNVVLNHVYDHGWTDYDGFSGAFVDDILKNFRTFGQFKPEEAAKKAPKSFFRLNRIRPSSFLDGLGAKLEKIATDSKSNVTVLSLPDMFPKMNIVKDEATESAVGRLDIPEEELQNAIRQAFRQIGATSIPYRGKDSPNEVADVEFFRLRTTEGSRSFAVVVKGAHSVSGKRLSWEDVSHQVTKAHMLGKPDHVIVMSSKEPKDAVITYLAMYGQVVDNPGLVLFVTPHELARLLISSGYFKS